MDRIENGIYRMVSLTGTCKSFPDALQPIGEGILKYILIILTYLCYIKYNRINIGHSSVKKSVSCEKKKR